MKEKMIFIGDMKEEAIHPVGCADSGRRYHNASGQIITYENMQSYKELKEKEADLASHLLVMEKLEDVLSELRCMRCGELIYMPRMKEWELDELIALVKQATAKMVARPCIGVAGMGESLGRMMMDLLSNFKIMQDFPNYHLLLWLPKEARADELGQMEDLLREYALEYSSVYIEQTIIENSKKYYYFLLNV